MKKKAQRTWAEIKDDPPGERFQRHFRRRQGRKGRMRLIAMSSALIFAGIVLLFIPGPGLLLIALGAALLAEESLRIARALDWSEIEIRTLIDRAGRVWRRVGRGREPPG